MSNLVRRTDCGDGRIPSITAESFTLAPMPPLPKPPPPDPRPPPSPPPPIDGCQYSCKNNLHPLQPLSVTLTSNVQGFCSDGGPNSVPILHDEATGDPIFMCDFGTQCSTLECGPRTVEQVEQPICSDVCRQTVSNGVSFTGASNNGLCEDGGDEISHSQYVDFTLETLPSWEANGYLRFAGCGYGTYALSQRQTGKPQTPRLSNRLYSYDCLLCVDRYGLHRLWA